RVFNSEGQARVLLARTGFPRGRAPSFRMPMDFWQQIVDLLVDGTLGERVDGLQRIVDEAVKLFPGNSFFANNCS
ncbi:MAG: hypothetical protein KDK70_41695, partial [Myxococcales bacterium]|nr:hypothetical protein [Myxococcales bacterium]